MHNNIMAAGSKDRPPMLGPGRYSQWRSRFLRYIDTKPNGEGLRKSILSGPYVPSTVLVQAVAATEGNPAIQQHTTIETVLNMTPENKEHFLSEKEAIFLLLTGIGDDIYSTVDACKTANEMWIAIERLQQAVSEGGHDNVADENSQKSKSIKHFLRLLNHIKNLLSSTKTSKSTCKIIFTRQSASTRHKGKEVAKPITPQSESVSEEDSDPEQAQRDKEMQKNLALLAKNKTEDTTPRYNNDNQSRQFGNQRTMTVARARETVGSQLHGKESLRSSPKNPVLASVRHIEHVDELESEKADFSNMYDLLLEECVSKDVICSYLHSLSELNAHTELQCMYLHKVKECECLAQKLSKQTESVDNEVHNKLLKSFAKLEKHSISLELSLQHCKEQMKNNPVCKENASNVFRKEREQYHEIQDLKAQMQDKNMVINELKKLILVTKGKSVETQFDKQPSVVLQQILQRIPKPSVF
ncbi:hypothetical protein Tco_0615028 [Tanacetum coccineum]